MKFINIFDITLIMLLNKKKELTKRIFDVSLLFSCRQKWIKIHVKCGIIHFFFLNATNSIDITSYVDIFQIYYHFHIMQDRLVLCPHETWPVFNMQYRFTKYFRYLLQFSSQFSANSRCAGSFSPFYGRRRFKFLSISNQLSQDLTKFPLSCFFL